MRKVVIDQTISLKNKNKLLTYLNRFCYDDETYFWFACHVALFPAFTPQLLYQIRHYFRKDELNNPFHIKYIAISDLLLSPLCNKIWENIFEMQPEIRVLLKEQLIQNENFGEERAKRIYEFMQAYGQYNPDKIYSEAFRTALLSANHTENLKRIARFYHSPDPVVDDMISLMEHRLVNVGNETEEGKDSILALKFFRLLREKSKQRSRLSYEELPKEIITGEDDPNGILLEINQDLLMDPNKPLGEEERPAAAANAMPINEEKEQLQPSPVERAPNANPSKGKKEQPAKKPRVKYPRASEPIVDPCSTIRADTEYIFTFGEFGCGKTTVNGMLTLLLDEAFSMVEYFPAGRSGGDFFHGIQQRMKRGEFPVSNTEGSVIEYSFTITHKSSRSSLNLTLLEISGESLEKISQEGVQETFDPNIEKYLVCNHASVTFILVADYDKITGMVDSKVGGSDFHLHRFLSYLYHRKRENGQLIDMSRIILLISKFDKAQEEITAEEIARIYLPRTFRFLEQNERIEDAIILPFSVGKVGKIQQDETLVERIEMLDLNGDIKVVAEYLLSLFQRSTKKSWTTLLNQWVRRRNNPHKK